MRRLIFSTVLVALVLCAATALAINPQYTGEPQFAPGGDTTVVTFGPYLDASRAPSSFAFWSGDGQPFWIRTFLDGAGTDANHFETTAWKIPASYMETAPAPFDSSGGVYMAFEIGAGAVAATDSVAIKPYFGGVGK